MTYQELVTEIKQLPLTEQLSLLDVLLQQVSRNADQRTRPGSSLERVRGMLKPEGPLPSDNTLAKDYTQYLIEKYT
jgi:hypothetical protein